jgi:hypothetical protein
MFEGPLSRITNAERCNAFARKVASRHAFLNESELEDDFWWFKHHLDQVYLANGTTPDQFADSFSIQSGLRVGISDVSLKMQFVPDTEDFSASGSMQETGGLWRVNAKSEQVNVFTDRNSFVCSVSEDGQNKFDEWH